MSKALNIDKFGLWGHSSGRLSSKLNALSESGSAFVGGAHAFAVAAHPLLKDKVRAITVMGASVPLHREVTQTKQNLALNIIPTVSLTITPKPETVHVRSLNVELTIVNAFLILVDARAYPSRPQ